jgi:RimJ/RimL family protein N-acetyltransferase
VKDEIIEGRLVALRLSTLADRRVIYDWFANSDLTASMAGEPLFPDSPPATWEEFCEDHTPHFFEGEITERGRCFIMQVNGEDVGQIYFNDIETKNGIKRVELDMWMRAESYCGKGYGSDALEALCDFLAKRFGVEQFMVQPSARNPRARRAYEKVGFVSLDVPLGVTVKEWGPNDYYDSVYMVKTIK